jgi:hypothetical protein
MSGIYILQEQGGPGTPDTGFPFVASYHSQGYSKGILTLIIGLCILLRVYQLIL